VKFTWDAAKAKRNLRDHRVTFDESVTVFENPLSILIPHPDQSIGERRLLLLGMSNRGRILVSHVFRGETVRIISARRAERRERKKYGEGN
jgi:uncharacterized protein